MKIITIKFIISILLIIGFGLFSIPKFSVKVGEKEFEYPELTTEIIGVGSTSVGTLRRGPGIFSEKRFETKVNFSNVNLSEDEKRDKLSSITNVVATRAKLAGLYDINISELNNKNDSLIVFDLPEHYSKPSNLISLLTLQGNIKFESYGQEASTPINLSDTDVVGNIQPEYDTRYGNYLSFNFDENKTDVLNSAFGVGGEGGVITMLVDDVPSFYLIPTTQSSSSEPIVTKVKALPSLEVFPDDKSQAQSLKIVASYFYNTPLEDNISFSTTEPKTLLPHYAPNGGSLIGIMFLISAIFCALYILYRNKIRSGIFFGILLSAYVLLSISILKVFGAIVSFGTVVGFLITYCLALVMIDTLLKASFEDYKTLLRKYSGYGFFISLLSVFTYRFTNFSGTVSDFTGMILVFSITGIVLFNTLFKYIIEFYHLNPKFTLKRKWNLIK